MIVFAVLSVFVIVAVAFVGLICAQYSADDLRNMGIRQ
jgi:hypothetical protein